MVAGKTTDGKATDERTTDEETSFDLDAPPSVSPSLEMLRRVAMGDASRVRTEVVDLTGSWLGPAMGDRPGRFELVKKLGGGGFGTVYRAFDHALGGPVALKVMSGQKARDLFLFKQEFRGLAELRHEHLIRLHELHQFGELWFFTMELVDGVPFDRFVRPDGVLDPERLREALRQLLRALHHLHEHGRVHRDIKPQNVLVDGHGRLVVLDFGLAVQTDEVGKGLVPGLGAGTRRYLAPENLTGGALGPAADLYAVGVMLADALLGRAIAPGEVPTFEGDLASLAKSLLASVPEQRPSAMAALALLGWQTSASGLVGVAGPDTIGTLGRELELERLREAWAACADGRARVVLVEGPSGVGKSALVDLFVERLLADADPSRPAPWVLRGRCHAEEAVPHKLLDGLVDQLASQLSALPVAEREAKRPAEVSALTQLFPVLGAVFPGGARVADAVTDPRELAAQGLADLLERIAAERPVVLVVDDLQWGDKDGAAILGALLMAKPKGRRGLFFVATTRPASDDGVERPAWLVAWLAQLGRRRSRVALDTVVLEPLKLAASTRLARALLADEMASDELAETIARASGGIPLFIRELARWTRTRGTAGPEDATPTGSFAPSLELMLDRRCAALSPPAARLLAVVSLAGRPVARRAAARAAELEDAPAALVELTRAHLAHVDDVGDRARLMPVHDRVRQAALQRLPEAERTDIFRRLAPAAEAEGGVDPAVLGAWYRGAGDTMRELEHCIEAGLRAADQLSLEHAAGQLQRALELMPEDDPRVGKVAARLGAVLGLAGHAREGAAAFLLAARHHEGLFALELERLGLDLIGQSGDVERAQPRALALLRRVGVKAPRTAPGALIGWLRARRKVRRRGLAFEPRPVEPLRRLALDARLTAGFLWSQTHFLRSWCVLTEGLHEALEVGDAERVATFLCVELGLAAMRAMEERSPWEQAVVEALGPLVARYPEVRGRYETALALNGFLHGDFERSADHAQRAEALLATRHDAGIDVHIARIFGLEALYLSGRWRLLIERLGAVEAAYGSGSSLFFAGIVDLQTGWMADLLADRPELGRERIARGSRFIDPNDRTAHIGRLIARVELALYESGGRGRLAAEALSETWGPLMRSGLTRIFPLVRVLSESIRLRVAMASGESRAVARSRRRLRRGGTRLGLAWEAVARAFIAGSGQRTEAALSEAELHFEARGMALHAASARWRRGRLLGGERGLARVASAEEVIGAEVPLPPERVVALLLPGTWPGSV